MKESMNKTVIEPTKSCLGTHDVVCMDHKDGETIIVAKDTPSLKGDENNINKKGAITRRSSSSRMGPLTLDHMIKYDESKHGRRGVDPASMDSAKLRRVTSNRLSAQRSRYKKAQYIREMEKKVNDLQATISHISPEIENYRYAQYMLMEQNMLLQQQLDSFTHKSMLLKGKTEEMQLEVKMLRELHDAQRYQKLQLLEYEENKENWGTNQYLNLELWRNSNVNP